MERIYIISDTYTWRTYGVRHDDDGTRSLRRISNTFHLCTTTCKHSTMSVFSSYDDKDVQDSLMRILWEYI